MLFKFNILKYDCMKNTGNIFRIIIIIINFLIYYYSSIDNENLFILNITTFNIFCFSLFIYFDDFRQNNYGDIELKEITNFKKFVSNEALKQSKKTFNWIVILNPLVIYFIDSSNRQIYSINFLLYFVLFLFLLVNVGILSIILKIYFKNLFFIYLISLGLIFQLHNMFFTSSIKMILISLIGFTILSYLFVIVAYLKIKKTSTYQNNYS